MQASPQRMSGRDSRAYSARISAYVNWRKPMRSLNSVLVTLAAACLLCPVQSLAQTYPSRPVKVVVPYGAGGTTDIVARIVSQRLSEMWGQPVVVENKSGAGGNIAKEFVAKSPPDGYTLLITGASFAMNPGIYKNIPYNAVRDFSPITRIASTPSIVTVSPTLPINSLKELIDYAKSRPGQVTFGSAGSGTTPHLAAELLATMSGTKMVHVPYKAEAMAMQDTMGGRIDVYIGSVPTFKAHISTGRLKGLATTGSARATDLPNLPTVSEAGVTSYEMTGWYGAYAPAGISPTILKKLEADFIEVIKNPAVVARLLAAGAEPIGSSATVFTDFTRSEVQKWGNVAKAVGATAD